MIKHKFPTNRDGAIEYMAPNGAERSIVATIPRSRLERCDACENWHLVLVEGLNTRDLYPFVGALLSLADSERLIPAGRCAWVKIEDRTPSSGDGVVEYAANKDEGLLTATIPSESLDWCDDCEGYHLVVFSEFYEHDDTFKFVTTLLALAVSSALDRFRPHRTERE